MKVEKVSEGCGFLDRGEIVLSRKNLYVGINGKELGYNFFHQNTTISDEFYWNYDSSNISFYKIKQIGENKE